MALAVDCHFSTVDRRLSTVELAEAQVEHHARTRHHRACHRRHAFTALKQGALDTRALQSRVRAGESILFFPEGTFRRASGLQPFKLGAFVIAAETGCALVPVTLNGTRSLLRDKAWLPNRSDIRVTVGAAILPTRTGWGQALELRDAARKWMAVTLAEPTIDD